MKITKITNSMSVFTNSIIKVASDGVFNGYIALSTQGDWEFIYEAGGDFNIVCADDFDWREAEELIRLSLIEIKDMDSKLHACAKDSLFDLVEYLESRLDDLENFDEEQD